ncbi:MAG TPA: type I-C CRISPR-associated protein Cas8c/Csd1 [Rhodoferax sp.]|nr:type I-C CRISPR-associated protein Cas8c/Csd1 [Rhodoferax sp.]
MLHALREYGAKLGGEPGFKSREVRWCIQLSEVGQLLNIVPLGDGKAGVMLEACPDMHAMNSGGKAHFLVESAQTIARHFKDGEQPAKVDSANARHQYYSKMLAQAAGDLAVLSPPSKLLCDPVALDQIRAMMVAKRIKPADWVTWQVGAFDPREDTGVQQWWRDWRLQDLGGGVETGDSLPAGNMLCLLTGDPVEPLLTQPKITGLSGVGGLSMGDVMVGFDKAAFQSYGLEKSTNAAMGEAPAQQYVDALNHLIRQQKDATSKNPSRRTNAMMVYWFKEHIPPEDDPFSMLYGMETGAQQTASALSQARKLLDAIRSGSRSALGNNHYYAMTLSGASGRVMVRDWMDGQFVQLVSNIEAWFSDLAIVHREGGNRLAPDSKFLAVGGSLVRDLKDLPASTTSVLWHAAVAQLPIPQPLMAQALDRFRSAIVKDETFSHARMGLIKAYFVRQPQGKALMQPYLNPVHPDPAYHCGRLLAILAKLQHAALGDVGAGVVQRFYAIASTAPGLTFGRLVGNSRNHLGKLEGGLSYWFEQQIAEVMGQLGDQFPRTLNLEG